MLRRFGAKYAVLSIGIDAILTLIALILAVSVRPYLSRAPFIITIDPAGLPIWAYILIPLLWITVFILSSVYDPKYTHRIVDEFQRVSLAWMLSAVLSGSLFYLILRDSSRWLFLTFIGLNIIFLIGWRLIARLSWHLFLHSPSERRVLIVGTGDLGRSVGQMIGEYDWTGLSLVGYLSESENLDEPDGIVILGDISQVRSVVSQEKIDDLVIALTPEAYRNINDLVLDLRDMPLLTHVVPDHYSLSLYQANVEDFGGLPMINLRDPALNEIQRLFKRLFDLLVGGTALLILMPFFGLVALAIKLDSRGPIFFNQQRIGENGQLFSMFKFRSMIVGSEKLQGEYMSVDKDGNILYKQRDDPRITRLGRFIRRTSLDEMPQLINVVQGTMSLVGPRPELPMMVGEYEAWQLKRFSVPQGMTGWWQINGRADKPMHLNTDDDIFYINNYSLWMDVLILLKTPWVVMRGRGAY